MKKIVLSTLCLALFCGAFAQSFTLKDTLGNNVSGASIQFIGNPGDEVIASRVNITNNSAVAKTVKVRKVIHQGDTLTGTGNTFCWFLCWGGDVYESPYGVVIQPGATETQFIGDYNPKNVPGITRISYVFFDDENRDDSVAVKIEYNASPASVDELISQVQFSDAYPNPAVNMVNVDYYLPESVKKATIAITNMLGSKVKEIKLGDHSGKARIPVYDLINGIYFYSLVADNQLVITRKFTVKR
jgi:hypothetical protein